jgi:Cu2+-exporting ATPase
MHILPAEGIRHVAGTGVSGTIDGTTYWLGAAEHAPFAPPRPGLQPGETTVLLYDAARPLGWFILGAATRREVPRLLLDLKRRGLSLELFSGDAIGTVEALALVLGIPKFAARLGSAAKLERLRELQRGGAKVLAVGDGLNDAPLLAAAAVSAAMPKGAALTQSQADLLLTGDTLAPLTLALDVAKITQRRIGQNLAWAGAYNLLVLPLAIGGHLAPWAAAAGMSLSSLVVVGNALRPGASPRNAEPMLPRTAEVL